MNPTQLAASFCAAAGRCAMTRHGLIAFVALSTLFLTPSAWAVPISSGTVLWLDGNDVDGDGIAEGAGETTQIVGVTTWVDKASGLGTTNVTQSVVSQQPVFDVSDVNLNSKSSFDFACSGGTCTSGGDVLLGTGLDLQTTDITLFAVFNSRVAVNGNNGIVNLGDTGTGTNVFTLEHNQGNSRLQLWDESAVDPLLSTNTYVKGAGPTATHVAFADKLTVTPNGLTRLSGDGDALTTGARSLPGHSGTGIRIGHLGPGNEFYEGNIAEVVVYNRLLDTPERVIMQNHLAAKWGKTLNALTDRYAGDNVGLGDYDEGVFGIGEDDATTVTTGTNGDGLILTELSSSLGDDEYVMAGHNVVTNSLTTSDIPNGYNGERWDRVFYVDVTGTVSADLTFDLSDGGGFNPNGGDQASYVLLYSEDDPFNFAALASTASIVGDQITFSLPSGMLLDGYYTLSSVQVPEPATLQLLALGAALLTLRRRRGVQSAA